MTIRHIISPWPTRVNMGYPWAWAHKPTGQVRWLTHALGEVHCFSKPYSSRRISSPYIYASQLPTIYRCGILTHMWSIFKKKTIAGYHKKQANQTKSLNFRSAYKNLFLKESKMKYSLYIPCLLHIALLLIFILLPSYLYFCFYFYLFICILFLFLIIVMVNVCCKLQASR